MAQTQCSIVVDGETIEEILSFDYSSDVMAIAEEAHFVVDNKSKKYRDMLRLGSSIEFRTAHPEINGGQPITRHRGVITRREPSLTERDGSVIKITSSDLGWHLQNNNVPIWIRLDNKTYGEIVDAKTSPLIDPSWGFTGVLFESDTRRRLKLGVAAVAAQQQRVLDPVHRIQTEPGDTPAELITEYARRLNLLLNVSPDGRICVFRPNDTQAPLYSLRLRDDLARMPGEAGTAASLQNNVLEVRVVEDARSLYTEVIVVGDPIGYEGSQDPNNPNASKKRGKVVHPGALPFLHRAVRSDGEMYLNGLAQQHAEWIYKRGIFDAWYATYLVAEHWQDGPQGKFFWEADTVVSVDDDEMGLSGNFYVQRVDCSGAKGQGDVTTVTIRKPGLLSASFGVIPTPSLYRASGITGTPRAAP